MNFVGTLFTLNDAASDWNGELLAVQFELGSVIIAYIIPAALVLLGVYVRVGVVAPEIVPNGNAEVFVPLTNGLPLLVH